MAITTRHCAECREQITWCGRWRHLIGSIQTHIARFVIIPIAQRSSGG